MKATSLETLNTAKHRFHLSIPALVLLLSTFNVQLSTVLAQGPLTPPGAPAPTMKTLDQVEPRTPISAFGTTLTVPGSYYLAANLVSGASTNDGILVRANNCLLYTSDAADERSSVDLGGRRIIKK